MNLMDPTQFAAAWNQIDPGDTRTDDAQEIWVQPLRVALSVSRQSMESTQ